MTTQKTKLAKFLTGVTLGAMALLPVAASAQSLAELIAKYPQLAAVLAPYMAATPSMGSAMCNYTFTMGLKTGSTGQEVWNLQKTLNMWADTKVDGMGAGSSGMETMYFGPATKSAVMRFQAKYASDVLYPSGLTAPTGMVGPATRAKLNALCQASQTTTTNTTTTTTTTVTTPSGLQGAAGSASVTGTSVDTDTVINTAETKKVLGFKVEATGSDLSVNIVRVRFVRTTTGVDSDRLTSYAKNLIVYANGTEVGRVSSDVFTRTTAGDYSANIPVTSIVRMGTANKVTYHVAIQAVDTIDTDDVAGRWTAKFVNIRYVDASGVTLQDSTTINDATGIQVQRISSSSDVKFRLSESSSNPTARNVQVSTSASTNVVLASFTLRAEQARMMFDTLKVTASATGAGVGEIASDFYLYRGDQNGTRIANYSIASSTTGSVSIPFSLDTTEYVDQDSSQLYTIVAHVNKLSGAFTSGDKLAVVLANDTTNIPAKTVADGKSVTNRAGSTITTYDQSLFDNGLTVALASKTTGAPTGSQQNTGSNSNKVTFALEFNGTVFGSNDVYIPLNATSTGTSSGAMFSVVDSSGNTITLGTTTTATLEFVSGGTQKTNSVFVTSGNTARLKLTVTYVTSTAGAFRLVLNKVGSAATDVAVATSVVTTLPVENFRTDLTAGMTP